VFDAAGKLLKTLSVEAPTVARVHPQTGAIYVLSCPIKLGYCRLVKWRSLADPSVAAVQKFDTIAEARDAARDSAKDRANPKLEAVMLEANKAYDRGDIDEARELAKKVVSDDPSNVRMLRVLVSTSCMDGDAATAKQYYATLPKSDQRQMQTRCSRYGVTFPDAPPVPPDPAP